jgi:hypothetical protein
MGKPIDITKLVNTKINYILILKEGEPHITSGGHRHRTIVGLCDCGKIWQPQLCGILNGSIKSCGCYSRKIAGERAKKNNTKHGKTLTTEYYAWVAIKKRCYNPNNKDYKDYGQRGILVCDAWKDSFENFLLDMGNKPSPEHSLDRIDVNGNYEPSNCRWATRKEQQRNKRNNVMFTYKGETKCISEWSEITGLSFQVIQSRINTGWKDDIIFMKSNGDRRKRYDKNRDNTPIC